jgi:hypothetical protein
VRKNTEIFPGFFILTTVSEKPGTRDMNELSLAIKTPEGLAVVVGCSHPGVDKVLENATSIDPQLYTVTGGFHLVVTPTQEVQRIAATLYDKLKIKRVAPGHCTSELGFKVLMEQGAFRSGRPWPDDQPALISCLMRAADDPCGWSGSAILRDLPIGLSHRPRDRSVVLSLHCMNDPQPEGHMGTANAENS